MSITDRYPTYELGDRKIDPAGYQPDQIKLFPAAGLDKDGAVAWLREGGCTAGCGACCEALVIPITGDMQMAGTEALEIDVAPEVAQRPGFEDWEYWLGLHDVYLFREGKRLYAQVPVDGIRVEGYDGTDLPGYFGIAVINKLGTLLAHIPKRCQELTDDRKCGLFGTPQRPLMCATYPQHPYDIEGLEQVCTYRFSAVTHAQALQPRAPRAQPKRKKGKKRRGRR